MYIVNPSFMVEPSVHEKWLGFITGRYIPFLEDNGFGSLVFTRVISSGVPEHHTYSLQVEAGGMEDYKKLTEELFAEYTDIAGPLFGEKVMWFTSLMKRIDYRKQ